MLHIRQSLCVNGITADYSFHESAEQVIVHITCAEIITLFVRKQCIMSERTELKTQGNNLNAS